MNTRSNRLRTRRILALTSAFLAITCASVIPARAVAASNGARPLDADLELTQIQPGVLGGVTTADAQSPVATSPDFHAGFAAPATVTLAWNDYSGFANPVFDVEVAVLADFSGAQQLQTAATVLDVSFADGAVHHWRVRARDGAQVTGWSYPRSFQIYVAPEALDFDGCNDHRPFTYEEAATHVLGTSEHTVLADDRLFGLIDYYAASVRLSGYDVGTPGSSTTIYDDVIIDFDPWRLNDSPAIAADGDELFVGILWQQWDGSSGTGPIHAKVLAVDVSNPGAPIVTSTLELGETSLASTSSNSFALETFTIQDQTYVFAASGTRTFVLDPDGPSGGLRIVDEGTCSGNAIDAVYVDYVEDSVYLTMEPNQLAGISLLGLYEQQVTTLPGPAGDILVPVEFYSNDLYVGCGDAGVAIYSPNGSSGMWLDEVVETPNHCEFLAETEDAIVAGGRWALDSIQDGQFVGSTILEGDATFLHARGRDLLTRATTAGNDFVEMEPSDPFSGWTQVRDLSIDGTGFVGMETMGPYDVVCFENGIAVYDMHDPLAPQISGWVSSGGDVWTSWDVRDGIAYVVSDQKLTMVRVEYVTNPSVLAVRPAPWSSGYIVVDEDHAFVTSYGSQADNVYCVDVSNPYSASVVGSVSGDNLYGNARVHRGVLFVPGYCAGLSRVDVRDPSAPVVLSPMDLYPECPTAIEFDGDRAVLAVSDGFFGNVYAVFYIMDASDPFELEWIGSSGPFVSDVVDGMSLQWPYVYAWSWNDVVSLVDVSDPSTTRVVAQWESPGSDSVQGVRVGQVTYAVTRTSIIDDTHELHVALPQCDPPQIIAGSETATMKYETGGTQSYWEFTWKTEAYTDPAFDRVEVRDGPRQSASCAVGTMVLEGWNPVVHTTVSEETDGSFLHTMTYGWDCTPNCSFVSRAESHRAGVDSRSATDESIHVKYCAGVVGGLRRDAVVSIDRLPALSNAVPNPFNPRTEISFYVPEGAASSSLRIYGLDGRLITELARDVGPGQRSVVWNGTDAHGVQVSTGVYFARLVVDDHVESKKLALIR